MYYIKLFYIQISIYIHGIDMFYVLHGIAVSLLIVTIALVLCNFRHMAFCSAGPLVTSGYAVAWTLNDAGFWSFNEHFWQKLMRTSRAWVLYTPYGSVWQTCRHGRQPHTLENYWRQLSKTKTIPTTLYYEYGDGFTILWRHEPLFTSYRVHQGVSRLWPIVLLSHPCHAELGLRTRKLIWRMRDLKGAMFLD